MPVYCNYNNWLSAHNKAYHEILSNLCYDDIRCNTLVVPNAALITKMSSMSRGDKTKRRECSKMISAGMIQINVSSKDFRPGTFKNNLGQSVKISAPTNGKFTIMSGKGYATKAEITINKTFEPDLQFNRDDDRHMCVCDIVSGEIAIDGEPYTGVQPIRSEKTEGGSEFVASHQNMRAEAWLEIINTTSVEISCGIPLTEGQVRLCGLLKFVMMKAGSISEYNHYADIIHTAMCHEPLATLYILTQPLGEHSLLNQQVIEDWGYAPYIGDAKVVYQQFCEQFPSKIDPSKRSQIISEIKQAHGVNKLYDLQEAYANHCKELFSHINYPCEMKLWCDEVCFYICNKMKDIRKSNGSVHELNDTLTRIYPGKNHSTESIINSDEYWNGFDKGVEVRNISSFVNSGCCFQSCCCGECCAKTENVTRSTFLKNLIMLNSD